VSAARPDPGPVRRLADWVVDSARLPFDRRWHRATRPGWVRKLYWLAAVGLAAVAVLSLLVSLGWRFSEPFVLGFVLAWWLTLLGLAAVVGRALTLGIWAGRGGIRIEWLFHREIVPWRAVHAMWVVPAPVSFGGRIERLVIETTAGERITVRGTDSYLHVLFRADSPDAVRHILERERRFYAGADLPRRQPGSRGVRGRPDPVVDLRTGEPEPAAPVAG
jgi:hypothetical protein